MTNGNQCRHFRFAIIKRYHSGPSVFICLYWGWSPTTNRSATTETPAYRRAFFCHLETLAAVRYKAPAIATAAHYGVSAGHSPPEPPPVGDRLNRAASGADRGGQQRQDSGLPGDPAGTAPDRSPASRRPVGADLCWLPLPDCCCRLRPSPDQTGLVGLRVAGAASLSGLSAGLAASRHCHCRCCQARPGRRTAVAVLTAMRHCRRPSRTGVAGIHIAA